MTDTALLEELRDLAEDGTLSLRVAEVLPVRLAAGRTVGWRPASGAASS